MCINAQINILNYKINTLIMNHAFRLITVDTINIILQTLITKEI